MKLSDSQLEDAYCEKVVREAWKKEPPLTTIMKIKKCTKALTKCGEEKYGD